MTDAAIPFLDADAVRRAAPIGDLLDAVQAAYRDVAAGRDRSPIRTRVGLDAGDLLLMPGVRTGGAGVSVKLVTVMPENAARGLPTIHAIVAWFDAATGQPLALLDGAALTAMRTGAASGVGTRLLARPDADTLALIGAGVQAEWQVRAVAAARPIRRVLVHARRPEPLAAFAAALAEGTGLEVIAAESADAAVREADVVCCATTSSEPVFSANAVRPGTHVNGIGSFRAGMVELPPGIFARAALVAVDSRAAALEEAGDLLAALDSEAVRSADLVEIGTIPSGWATDDRPADAITVFKSVGLAIQDVAAAELIVSRALGRDAAT